MYFIDGTFFILSVQFTCTIIITHLPNHISFQSCLPSTIADKTVSEGIAYLM